MHYSAVERASSILHLLGLAILLISCSALLALESSIHTTSEEGYWGESAGGCWEANEEWEKEVKCQLIHPMVNRVFMSIRQLCGYPNLRIDIPPQPILAHPHRALNLGFFLA